MKYSLTLCFYACKLRFQIDVTINLLGIHTYSLVLIQWIDSILILAHFYPVSPQ